MKKIIIQACLVCCFAVSLGQVIHGTVLEDGTKIPVCYATVFFNGTFDGTSSDQNGNFTLDVSKHSSMPLTITAVGYYSGSLTSYSADKPIVISLKPKTFEIKEVVVNAKSLERKRKANLYFFKTLFLGTSENAMKCKILNEQDITFNYYTDKDTFKAFSSKPILIENRALGYNISYYLDKCEFYRKNQRFQFSGNMFFNEDIVFEKESKKPYERRRENTYLGSRMHFFRSLWAEKILSENFVIKDTENELLRIKDIVVHGNNGQRFLKNVGDLSVLYYKNQSRITFLKSEVYFDRTGYYDATAVDWGGELARQRIADWLPYEYLP
jgi:hypothetical protein